MRQSPQRFLVLDAPQTVLRQRRPRPGFLYHCDRGWQFVSFDGRSSLARNRIMASISCRGNFVDSATMESFFASLKAECVRSAVFATHNHAQAVLSEYIKVMYYGRWLHSLLNLRTPVEFELMSTVS